jgi:hypothetical protein
VFKTKFFIIVAIVILGFVVYGNSFNNEFVYDDEDHVIKNTVIRSFKNLPLVFQHNLIYFSGVKEGKFFRPTESITFMADFFLWGLDSSGYHLTNTLFHILVSILLFYMIYIVTKYCLLSGMVGIMYLVHPVHTEAVSYISGRADSLASVFLLLMIIFQYRFWINTKQHKKIFYYILLLFSFLLGLLSKESAMIFPLLLMLFEYCTRSDKGYTKFTFKTALFYVPIFVLMGIWYLYKSKVVPTEVMVEDIPPLSAFLAALPRLIFDYVKLSLFPFNLHMEYKLPFPSFPLEPYYSKPIIFIFVFLGAFYYLWRKGKNSPIMRIMFFGLAWFLLALFPYMNIVFVMNAVFAEHWLYIPEMGFVLFLVGLIFYCARKSEIAKRFAIFFCMFIIALSSFLTIKQNRVWKDPISFFTHTIKHSPKSENAHNQLALEYIKRGDLLKAEKLLEEAVRIEPRYTTAAENLQMLKMDIRRRGLR